MKFLLLLFTLLFSLSAYSADVDPWGDSGYDLKVPSAIPGKPPNYVSLTNQQAEHYRSLGIIKADGTVKLDNSMGVVHSTDKAPPKGPPALPPQPPAVVEGSAPVPVAPIRQVAAFKVQLADKAGQPPAIKPKTVAMPSLLNVRAAPKQTTRSKPATAKKYVHVKAQPVKPHPTLPANATQADYKAWHQEVRQTQQHMAHIEQSISKALDLSLSASAMAQLPQATQGRSSFSFGVAAADGRDAEAIGYSANFGEQHEYTVKISVGHSGTENTIGTGFGIQW